jgi:hypothetical protein
LIASPFCITAVRLSISYKVAEEFLLYANWSGNRRVGHGARIFAFVVLKNPDCSNELKSQLYRNFGKSKDNREGGEN